MFVTYRDVQIAKYKEIVRISMLSKIAVLPHRTFFKVLYFFFTISRFCTFFVLFSGLVLFLYFFFHQIA